MGGGPWAEFAGFVGLRRESQRGLLGLASHPGYAEPSSPGFHRLYTYTSEPAGSGVADFTVPLPVGEDFDEQTGLAEWQVDAKATREVDPDSRRELLRLKDPQFNHYGWRFREGMFKASSATARRSRKLFYADLDSGLIHEFQLGAVDRPLETFVKGFGQGPDGERYLLAGPAMGPFGSSGQVLKITAVPESAAWIALAMGALAGCGWRVRRRDRRGRKRRAVASSGSATPSWKP